MIGLEDDGENRSPGVLAQLVNLAVHAWKREVRRVRSDGRELECPVYQRERLDVGLTVAGPAILDQFDCTTVICPGQTARVDEWKNLIVT